MLTESTVIMVTRVYRYELDPNDPFPCDGTVVGNTPSSFGFSFLDVIEDTISSDFESWWTGPWPILHLKCAGDASYNGDMSSATRYDFEMEMDLLGSMSISSSECDTPVDDGLTDEEVDDIAAQGIDDFYNDAFPIHSVLLKAACAAWLAIDVFLFFSSKLPSAKALAGLVILLGIFTAAFFFALATVCSAVGSGEMSPGAAIEELYEFLYILPIEGIFSVVNGMRYMVKYASCKNFAYYPRVKVLMGFMLIAALVKFFLTAILLVLLSILWQMSVEYYNI